MSALKRKPTEDWENNWEPEHTFAALIATIGILIFFWNLL